MAGVPEAFIAFLLAGGVHQSQAPSQLPTATEICGHVIAFTAHRVSRCDAALDVRTAERGSATVLLSALARRGSPGGRELVGAEACFTGKASPVENGTVLHVSSFDGIRVTKAPPSPPFGAGATDFCISSGLVEPRALTRPLPRYPQDALKAAVQGDVQMEALVDSAGTVADVRVVRPLDKQLDEEALKTLRTWTFAPGTLDGKAVPVVVLVEMTFRTSR